MINGTSTPKRLSLAVVGLGRMGKQHAMNALHAPRISLKAVCSPLDAEKEWAEQHLAPHGVHFYRSLDELLENVNGTVEALLIASTTKVHYEQVMMGMRAGKHVLVEKPLAMGLEESQKILTASREPQNAEIKIMTAFSRRFDASYTQARKAIQNDQIGDLAVLRFENRDKFDDSEAMKRYLSLNPGIFVDSAVHDIDLALSFLGEDAEPKSAYAVGNVALHHDLKAINDVDNAVGIVEWHPVSKDGPSPISYHYCSRISQHGFDNPTEIAGTKGALKINLRPRDSLIDIADGSGVRNTVMPDYYGRYEHAFVHELNTFAACVLDGTELPYGLESAVKGMRIAQALQRSLRSGEKILFERE